MRTWLIIFCCLFLLQTASHAQWKYLGDPGGSSVDAFAANDSFLFVGSSGIYRTSDYGKNWAGGGGGYAAIFTLGPIVIASDWNIGVYRSRDNGRTWTKVTNWSPKMVKCFAKRDSNLFAGSWDKGVFLSTNGGENWSLINSNLPDPLAVNAFTMIGDTLFAGFISSIFFTTNHGATWTEVSNGLPTAQIEALAVIDTTLFASCNSHGVYRSIDRGANWIPVNTGLPSKLTPTSFCVYGDNIFTGIRGGGVNLSTNFGDSWTNVSDGFADNFHTTALFIRDGYLFAGTEFSGISRRSLSDMIKSAIAPSEQLLSFSCTAFPNPLTSSTTITYTLPERSVVRLEVYDVLGRKVGRLGDLAGGMMDAGEHSAEFDARGLADGVYTAKLMVGGIEQNIKMVLQK